MLTVRSFTIQLSDHAICVPKFDPRVFSRESVANLRIHSQSSRIVWRTEVTAHRRASVSRHILEKSRAIPWLSLQATWSVITGYPTKWQPINVLERSSTGLEPWPKGRPHFKRIIFNIIEVQTLHTNIRTASVADTLYHSKYNLSTSNYAYSIQSSDYVNT